MIDLRLDDCGWVSRLRLESGIFAEQNRIASALKTGEIMQRHGCLGAQFNQTARLPMPFSTLGSKGHREWLAVDEHLKFARSARGMPRCHPVARPHPDPVLARRGNGRYCCISAPPAGCGRPRWTICNARLGLARWWRRRSMISIIRGDEAVCREGRVTSALSASGLPAR